MAKLSALIIAGAVATAGLSQAAFAQTSAPSPSSGALLGAGIADIPSQGSADVNGPGVGNGGQMTVTTPSNEANRTDMSITRNPSRGSADVNGPGTGNGGNFNSAGERTSHITQNPSRGSDEVNGPAVGNGGNMGTNAGGQ